VSRHKHFAQASIECNVTQLTLSLGIDELEHRLGYQLVRRGRRFEGLTAEGQIAATFGMQMVCVEREMKAALEYCGNQSICVQR